MGQHLKIAELDQDNVSKIRALEENTGFHIMAFEPAVTLSAPTEEQLNQIQSLEKELNVTLLAYEAL
jgi:hypothetical protein